MNPLLTTGLSSNSLGVALSVNLNKVALLRNTRSLGIPSVLQAARIALDAGAQGVTVHPRPDERHIRAHDVHELAELMKQWPHAEFNIEGNPLHNLMDFVRAMRPHQCTFVPDAVAQATSDHGWNLTQDAAVLQPLVHEAQALGVRVSLFMDPTPQAMQAASYLGVERVELYTESYARAYGTLEQAATLATYAATAQAAAKCGLGVNAGHDLNQSNLTAFLQAVPQVQEVSIGHALIADALELGLAETLRRYLHCIAMSRSQA